MAWPQLLSFSNCHDRSRSTISGKPMKKELAPRIVPPYKRTIFHCAKGNKCRKWEKTPVGNGMWIYPWRRRLVFLLLTRWIRTLPGELISLRPKRIWDLSPDPRQEAFYVLSGELEITLDGHHRRCPQQTFVYVDKCTNHELKAITDCQEMPLGCVISNQYWRVRGIGQVPLTLMTLEKVI